MVICPPDHRFKDHDLITPPQLAEECLLLNEDAACPIRQFVADLCEEGGVRPRRQHFGNGNDQIMEMIQASLGVSVAGERQTSAAPLLRRPIDAASNTRTVVLAAAAGRQLGPTPAMFLKLMRAHAWDQPKLAA